MHVDEDRASIIEKQKELKDTLQRYPKFRAGHFHLATTWLQMHREREAVQVLEHYHSLFPDDPTAEYYLAALHFERYNYPKAWKHLKRAQNLTQARNHRPKALQQLHKALSIKFPDPQI